MPHNPVQIVLNSKDYLTTPELTTGGSSTDFFAGRDGEFEQHRARLARQVASVGKTFRQSGVGTGFVKVKMRKEAWAKSHRPTDALFPPRLFPCVGGSGLGELFYQVTETGLNAVAEKISAAESETRWKSREIKGKVKTFAAPSTRRSEVGAIESISVLAAPDKRKFSTEEAVRWLSDPRTSGAYLVELFRPLEDELQASGKSDSFRRTAAVAELERAIKSVGLFAEVFPIQTSRMAELGFFRIVGVRLVRSATGERPTPVVPGEGGTRRLPFDGNVENHSALLEALDHHALVRRIGLPPVLLPSQAVRTQATGAVAVLPEPQPGTSYPKVGVVDGGIGPSLSKWVIGRNSLVAPAHQTLGHGTFIGGLLVSGRSLNGASIAPEADGCELYDIAIFPDPDLDGVFEDYYPRGALDFLEELSMSVDSAKQEHGIRVFNLSLNLFEIVEDDCYSVYAEILDDIADAHDVVFVLSAGNLETADYRPIWPADAAAANKILAARTSADTLLQPTESSRSIAVGALNTPGVLPHIAGTPASYSRRGPGLRVGIKPDLAHYGGCTPVPDSDCTGLLSVDPSGLALYGLGTSYATPLVSKTLAVLDAGIEGEVSRETLFALAVHHARIPAPLNNKDLYQVARQFVGFGIPSGSEQMLVTGDDSITLVFADTLNRRKELQFDFAWPRCLVTPETGACRGTVRMTLVYRSVLKAQFGAEFVRVNVDAHLRQATDEAGHYKGQLGQSYLPDAKGETADESELIEYGLKWWPIKVYERTIPRGIGKSSAWRLVVDSLTRADQIFPPEGVPFTVVLTIGDSNKEAANRGPVFQQLRQDLLAHQVQMTDIRTANRIRPRP